MQKTKQDLKRLRQHLVALELLQRKLQKEVNDTKEAVKELAVANDKVIKIKEKKEKEKEDRKNGRFLDDKRKAEEAKYFLKKTQEDLEKLKRQLEALENLQKKLKKGVKETAKDMKILEKQMKEK
uniref:Uncharacterized protein n=1 Tax=Glossina pallidipes TaxID=7398 RepID=A0A1A9Z268_GLOPL